MKILFLNPWTKSLFGDSKQANGHPHLGLAYLIATCKKHGYNKIKVFDQGIEKNDAALFELINSFGPDIIAITSFSYCYNYAKDIINQIKVKFPQTLLIAGGAHISATKEMVLKDTQTDFAMKSESELTFLDFLRELEKNNPDFSKVDNLIWKYDNSIIENKTADFITDLDSIPFPDYEAFTLQRYPCYRAHLMPIITSRGCPYGCNYCSIRLSMGRNFRARSPLNVVKEMEYLKNTFEINHFEINDDCFSFDLSRAEKICDLIIESGLNIKYELYNGIRADNASENLLQKMKKSGCVFISYGCESGNQEIIDKFIKKSLNLKKVVEAVNLTNKVGIKNSVNFIIGHPGETYEKAMETIRFARSLKTNFVNFYNLIPYPGTEAYDWIKANASYRLPAEEYLENIGARNFIPVFETKEFSREERIKVLEKGNSLFEKTLLQFRLGKFIGFLVYLLCRNKAIFKFARTFAFDGKIGSLIYRALSRKSREVE